MANSKYEYVRQFELPDPLLPNTYILIRIDGRSFHSLSAHYSFLKPNDARALRLMSHAATAVLRSLPDITLAYGISDEYSFLFHRSCTLFDRRASKLVSTVVSTFTAAYVHAWRRFLENDLQAEWLPSFDGRAVMLPSEGGVRDYFAWRQVDCHINNLYNTTFWALVQKGGMGAAEAEQELAGTFAKDKNEILFKRFGINYNNEEDLFKKGTLLFRDYAVDDDTIVAASSGTTNSTTSPAAEPSTHERPRELSKTQAEKQRKRRQKAVITTEHIDLIRDQFWEERPWILSGETKVMKEDKGASG